jgi:predicted nuclease of restriction endonuclease-like (RecB) superfamily
MYFDQLQLILQEADHVLRNNALRSVNASLTARNWIMGCYIAEFELRGEDRGKYGEALLEKLAQRLNLNGLSARSLYLYRRFFMSYPNLGEALDGYFRLLQAPLPKILQTVSAKLLLADNEDEAILQTVSAKFKNSEIQMPPQELLTRLSFSHLAELFDVDNPLARTFYEAECIRGGWSVRELRRQVGSLLFERTGLSVDKVKLLTMTQGGAERMMPRDIVRDTYMFEFLGLKSKDIYTEKEFEAGLMDNLEEFLLELGKGFCFEARQKRIVVDNQHYFIDLVFYHRILRCNVLIELKSEKFDHTQVGQLNFYLGYYRKYEMREGDNPPIGILLCTAKDAEHVEFATAGVDHNIFVSQYRVALPSEQELEEFLRKELEDLTNPKRT